MVSLDRCGGICSILDNESDMIYILDETEDVNEQLSNMIIGFTDSNLFVKHVLCNCRCRLVGKQSY